MLYTVIKENTYQDSIVLMLLSNKLSGIDGVNKASVMMGTPANKDIFKSSGLATDELEQAGANDIVIVIDTDNPEKVETVKAEVEAALKGETETDDSTSNKEAASWKQALDLAEKPNLALISIPGTYAAMEAENALKHNLNVFMFSDNVAKEDEVKLKQLAHDKGLLVMGPDCGTGIVHGVPLAFTNTVSKGDIGIVGASGTGIQEVTTIIDRLGKGVTNAIGTGGRDLSTEVGAVTMIDSIKALNADPTVNVITVISKPPAKEVQEKVMNTLRNISKPIVTLFLGHKPTFDEQNIYNAYTLEEAAVVSVQLANGETPVYEPKSLLDVKPAFTSEQTSIKGFYSGGTLAYEAAILIQDAFDVTDNHSEGYTLKSEHHEVIDLGDDMYTQGKPHPMIDPEIRKEKLRQAVEDERTAVIMLDNVIGYGSHDDMANELAPIIGEVIERSKQAGREIIVLATVVGTTKDYQGYEAQKTILANAGAHICDTNDQMVRTAIELLGGKVIQPEKTLETFEVVTEDLTVDDKVMQLINNKPSVINIGLKSFTTALQDHDTSYVQFNWKPIAGGDTELIKVLQFLNNYEKETE
ncbi:acyl-CoA synthetase FdrA [Staphylococcus americanisciuri]|uniref:Acyl-CoA synthetase FdrA n=1 Tax=Staphylococcus americanisciuri TaxID=2973940 RepID=A0ABT2F0E3_9STAP|nr:acyl-CoA synthetase FdrA [Staphylococcus americanisciuri]MCS4485914.1 acyl-CoA synthetase FdrA [Staphylococcus americanisciuri]